MEHICYREELFRVDGRSAFRGMFVALLLVGCGIVAFNHFAWGRPFYWFWDGVVAPLLYAVMLWGVVFYLRRRLTVSVQPEGLRTFDVWGRYHTVPWESITAAKRWSFFGMPSGRIRSDAVGSPLWLPLYLDRRGRFDLLVAEYTEQTNPLRTLLSV